MDLSFSNNSWKYLFVFGIFLIFLINWGFAHNPTKEDLKQCVTNLRLGEDCNINIVNYNAFNSVRLNFSIPKNSTVTSGTKKIPCNGDVNIIFEKLDVWYNNNNMTITINFLNSFNSYFDNYNLDNIKEPHNFKFVLPNSNFNKYSDNPDLFEITWVSNQANSKVGKFTIHPSYKVPGAITGKTVAATSNGGTTTIKDCSVFSSVPDGYTKITKLFNYNENVGGKAPTYEVIQKFYDLKNNKAMYGIDKINPSGKKCIPDTATNYGDFICFDIGKYERCVQVERDGFYIYKPKTTLNRTATTNAKVVGKNQVAGKKKSMVKTKETANNTSQNQFSWKTFFTRMYKGIFD